MDWIGVIMLAAGSFGAGFLVCSLIGERIVSRVLRLIARYGGIDGDHHKAWVLDQVVRILTGDKYNEWVKEVRDGEDGPCTYSWDKGVAP